MNGPGTGRRGFHAVWLWVLLTALLLWPVHVAFTALGGSGLLWRAWLATFGVVGLFIASSAWASRRAWGWLAVALPVLLAILFVRMLFFGLVRFSGHGFGAEFFISLEPESVRVAWNQYRYLFRLLFGAVAVLVLAISFGIRRAWRPRRRQAVLVALASLILLLVGHRGSPEWLLAHTTHDWYAPKHLSVAGERLDLWRRSPLLNVDLVTKQRLWAKPATSPKNLILLYIESGGIAMAPADRYPGLMPNFKRLIREHGLVQHIHASSFITIEGIVNTECGTLYPFNGSSDAMAGFDRMLEQMPCLGDVLHAAGYRQTYFGGADKNFSGKGRFLALHGYDKVLGQREWLKLGVKPPAGDWGVSDVDLFKQSFAELRRLKASGHPFNLTLLTIGTHLPGFSYAGCTPYGDGKSRFLDAAHCTDQLVGRWIDQLRAEGLLDPDTYLVITGDHQIFPNGTMQDLFGEDAVQDVRLPLIVLGGAGTLRAAQHDGAGYDIAPTILDLLGVTTNARFALGRSLLAPTSRPDYFLNRYFDVHDEQRVEYGEGTCDKGADNLVPGTRPLSQCERDELRAILHAQAAAYSAPPSTMDCDSAEPLAFALPAATDAPIRFMVSGRDESQRFIWRSRTVMPTARGLYFVALDAHGNVLRRDYYPSDQVATAMVQPPAAENAALWLIAWRPDKDAKALPAWLRALGVQHAGASLFAVSAGNSPRRLQQASVGQTLEISRAACAAELSPVTD